MSRALEASATIRALLVKRKKSMWDCKTEADHVKPIIKDTHWAKQLATKIAAEIRDDIPPRNQELKAQNTLHTSEQTCSETFPHPFQNDTFRRSHNAFLNRLAEAGLSGTKPNIIVTSEYKPNLARRWRSELFRNSPFQRRDRDCTSSFICEIRPHCEELRLPAP